MKSRDFCYWLQGYFELASAQGLTKEQVDTIRAHLAMVFVHEIDHKIRKLRAKRSSL